MFHNIKRSIPNMFTLGNLLSGFIAIFVIIHKAEYEIIRLVPTLIIIAMIFDFLDGNAARLLKVHNEIGKQLDSLADIITFGVVPALFLYEMGLTDLGLMGVLIVSLLPITGAMRLARFNVATDSGVSHSFLGLPITASGGVIAVLSVFASKLPIFVLIGVTVLISFLMISQIKYPNWKHAGKKMKVAILFLFVFAPISLIFLIPDKAFHIIFSALVAYVVYGMIFSLVDRHHLVNDEEEQENLH